jgi:hypothetical protein
MRFILQSKPADPVLTVSLWQGNPDYVYLRVTLPNGLIHNIARITSDGYIERCDLSEKASAELAEAGFILNYTASLNHPMLARVATRQTL